MAFKAFRLLLLFLCPILTEAQHKKKLNLDSLLSKDLKLLPMPSVLVGPEIGLKMGAFVDYFYKMGGKNDTITRPSQAFVQFLYSTRHQMVTELYNSSYTKNEKYYIFFRGGYINNYEQYWGLTTPTLANNDYIPARYRRWHSTLRVTRNLGKRVFLGGGMQFNQYYRTDFGQDIHPELVPQQPNSTMLGFGPLFRVDRRDNQFSPTKGFYFDVYNLLNYSMLTKKFAFNSFNLDVRKYQDYGRHVWANQLLFGTLSGDDIPIFEKLKIGGDAQMRGYFMGRFRDDNLWVYQTEYRYRLNRFLKLACFASAGNTSPELNGLFKQQVRFAGGTGLRLLLNKKKKVYARVDFAFSDVGMFGYYLRMGDAF